MDASRLRYIEALLITLIAVIGGCFAWELVASRPDIAGIAKGFIPTTQIVTDLGMLFIAIGILGATVMPHNLYLHSSIVQTRRYELNARGKREAIKFATIDSTLSGEKGTTELLVLSQVILSLQVSFAVFPLVMFTSDSLKIGEFANGWTVKCLAWFIAIVIASLNAWLLVQTFRGWFLE